MTDEKPADIPPGNGLADLFKDVKYYLVGSIDSKVIKLLNDGGGKQDNYLSEMVSHVIADSIDQDEYCEAKELFDLPVVTSQWVTLSVRCKKQLPLKRFSPEGLVFAGIVVCPAKLDADDQRHIWGMVTYYGGRCRSTLTPDVTHLITGETDPSKVPELPQDNEKTHIVGPDWITDSVNEGKRLDEELYHPQLIIVPSPPRPPKSSTPPPIVTVTEPEDPKVDPAPVPAPPPTTVELTPDPNPDPFSFTGADDPSKQDPYTAKEALARMVSNRLQACGKSPESKSPVGTSPLLPPPVPQTNEVTAPFTPLRNITNGALEAAVPPLLATPPRPAPKTPSRGTWPVGIHQAKSNQAQSDTHSSLRPTYYGHDSNDKIPTDMSLLGCIFYVAEYQKILGTEVISNWKQVIEQHGGQVDPAYSNRVTHLLCPHQHSDVFQLALKDQRRVITAYWLNDCLVRKRMAPPWQSLHLPLIYGDHKPCTNQIVTISNYAGEERTRIKQMLTAVGAKYTGYMAHSNSVLICKQMDGTKALKAKEWKIPIVNVTWVSDLVLGCLDALRLPVNTKYLSLGQTDEFAIDVNRVAHLMVGWRNPLKVTKEALRKFIPSPKLKNKKASLTEETLLAKRKAEEELDTLNKRQRIDYDMMTNPLPSSLIGCPIVTFTGYRGKTLTNLKKLVMELGGRLSENPRECTHLVARSLLRTVKMFMCINIVRAVVTKEWVEDSHFYQHFIEEQRYRLKDRDAEVELNCDLFESLRRAQTKPLFQNIHFYLTPSVMPSIMDLANVIETAGGKVLKKLPSAKKIITEISDKGYSSYVIISCHNDLQLCRPHIAKNIPIHSAEYVLTGVLRQDIDNNMYRLKEL